MSSFLFYLSLTFFLITGVTLVLLILAQGGRGGGLSGALRGGAAGSVFGTKSDKLGALATGACFFALIALAAALSRLIH
jgi:preprotein translocase subunit SecG